MLGVVPAQTKRVIGLSLLAMAACAPGDAAMQNVNGSTLQQLRSDYMKALTAEQCAIAKSYLSPLYQLPASDALERSVQQAETVGLTPVLAAAKRKWNTRRSPSKNCLTDPYKAHDFFTASVRAFDATLDDAIEQALARPFPDTQGTSGKLVTALVTARWSVEFSRPNACAAGGEANLAAYEKARFDRLRDQARRQGRSKELEATDRRWAAEKVKWDRDTATVNMIIPCAARKLKAGNDVIANLLNTLAGARRLGSKAVPHIQSTYWSVLKAETCARSSTPADPAIRARLTAAIANAERAGFGPALEETRKKWDHFQTVAEWECPPGSGTDAFRDAVTAFLQALETAER